MAGIGQVIPPGEVAPVAGTFVCTEPGCTGSFIASVAGTPLPPGHHAGASWRLTEIRPVSLKRESPTAPRGGGPPACN